MHNWYSLFETIKYDEPLVLRMMRDVYGADPSLCRGGLCHEDVFALSLNALPPRYIQTTGLRAYESSTALIDEGTVKQKVTEAVAKVLESPRHRRPGQSHSGLKMSSLYTVPSTP